MENKLDNLSQSQRERLVYIEFRAYFLGEIKRSDISERFGVASAAATRDLAHYRELSEGSIVLDQSTKIYIAKENFKPIFEHIPDNVLTALSQGFGEAASDKTKPILFCEVPRVLSRPNIEILSKISRAIYRRKIVFIDYNSFSSGKTSREIAPFALINNGLRWHARAFDRRSNEFRDFVLTRIENPLVIEDSKPEDHELSIQDAYWSRLIDLELVPHPDHSEDHAIIKMDYEMSEGVLKVKVRAAIAGYLLRQWSVDCSPDHSLTGEEFRLWLRNNPVLYGVDSAKLAPGVQHKLQH